MAVDSAGGYGDGGGRGNGGRGGSGGPAKHDAALVGTTVTTNWPALKMLPKFGLKITWIGSADAGPAAEDDWTVEMS